MAVDKKILLRDALKQVQTGKLDKAVEVYKAILKADPRDAAVHNALGDLFVKQGKKKEAIAEYLEVAELYEKEGFPLRAVAICQKVINIDPDQIAVRVKLGDLYAAQKLPAEGRAQYMHVADYYDRRGEVANALEIFRKIANLDPGNLAVRLKLAQMFEKQKFPEKAAEEYIRAAKGYVEKKELEPAAQLYVRAFKLFPANLEARRWLADFYARRQEWSVVVGLLETPVVKGSHETGLLLLYAESLAKVDHPLDAVKVLEGVLKREPDAVPVNLALARVCLKIGDLEKGNAAINRCVSAHLAGNNLEAAESLLREMALIAPENDVPFQRLLEVAKERGEQGAIAQAHLDLAAVYEKTKLPDRAAEAIRHYLEINPGDAEATRRLELLQGRPVAPKVEAPVPPPRLPPLDDDDVIEIKLDEDEGPAAAAAAEVADEELVIDEEDEELVAAAEVADDELVIGEVDDEPAAAAEVADEELVIGEADEELVAPAEVTDEELVIGEVDEELVAPAEVTDDELVIGEMDEELVATAEVTDDELVIGEVDDEPAAAAAEVDDEELRALTPDAPAIDDGINLDEEIDLTPSAEPDVEITSFSDFLTALNQETEALPDAESTASPPPQGEAGLTEIFREFQRSVVEQVGDEDFETHYNLGIAYKEMGLMEEAIAELALAEKSPARAMDALSMIALCLCEMGRFDEAALRLRTGISLAVEGSEAQKGFLYDLAALHEKTGRAGEARETLQRLLAIDPGYRDAAARVDAATAETPETSETPRKKSKVSYL